MADDLKTIVQRMLDAGESEANIGTVIQHFNRTHATQPSLGQMMENRPIDEAGNPIEPTGRMANLVESLRPLAQPKSLGDFSSLLLPNAMGKLPLAGRNIRQVYRDALETHPKTTGIWQGIKDFTGELLNTKKPIGASPASLGTPLLQLGEKPSNVPSPFYAGGAAPVKLESQAAGMSPVAQVTAPKPPVPGGIGTAPPGLVQAHTEALHNVSADARDALRATEAEHPISVAGAGPKRPISLAERPGEGPLRPPLRPTKAPLVQTPQQWQAADRIQAVASHRASMGGMQSAARAYKTPQELLVEALRKRQGMK